MGFDIRGIYRGACKECDPGECDTYTQGPNGCSYCFHPPTMHKREEPPAELSESLKPTEPPEALKPDELAEEISSPESKIEEPPSEILSSSSMSASTPIKDDDIPTTSSGKEGGSQILFTSPVIKSNTFNPRKHLEKRLGIKLYTPEEINKAYGERKQKCEHFNITMINFMQTPSYRWKSKSFLKGMWRTQWASHSAKLLKLESQSLAIQTERLKERLVDGKPNLQATVIERNVEKLDSVEGELRSLHVQLKGLGVKSDEREKLESDILTLVSKRDKVIDALRKACKVKKSEIDNAIRACREQEAKYEEAECVDDDSIIAAVKSEGTINDITFEKQEDDLEEYDDDSVNEDPDKSE